ncbi:hypothetical protein QR77_41475 [Streptomyces sp. 150FB]|uniref:hypothetical protein n=1 Tax=Streptomyces sp. 150FB TaxID=1576605 RepID=UPI0005890B92|nr:hypothetical protein [Streptomyces sp. 150FB]KIF72755.1 hypothetical protein QR77_41475 [Streptomyces sp. 150FB]
MSTTLVDLYTRYSERLAAHVADGLGMTGTDTDDVTQEVWLEVAQLSALPEPDQAWAILMGLADRVIDQGADYRQLEVPYGALADVPNPMREAEPARTLTEFHVEHGECSTRPSADIETYEHLVEGAHPAIAHAFHTDLVVVGRHAEADQVVVDLRTAEELEASKARTTKTHITPICETALAS